MVVVRFAVEGLEKDRMFGIKITKNHHPSLIAWDDNELSPLHGKESEWTLHRDLSESETQHYESHAIGWFNGFMLPILSTMP